jgi:hypothetical protein
VETAQPRGGLGLGLRARSPPPGNAPNGPALIGDYNADLFVDNRLIIELKEAKALADEPVAQILGYLRSSGVEHGLLINFGAPKLEIKEYALSRIGEATAQAASSEELFHSLRLLRLFAAGSLNRPGTPPRFLGLGIGTSRRHTTCRG